MESNPKPKFEDYIGLITKAAWYRVCMNPKLNVQDLISEAKVAFYEKYVNGWNPEKGKFSTYLTWQLRDLFDDRWPSRKGYVDSSECYSFDLMDQLMNWEIADCPQLLSYITPESETSFKMALDNLGQEAKEVVSTIFFSGGELVDLTVDHVRTTQSSIKQYFLSLGWKHTEINNAFLEIREALRSI